MVKNDYKYDMTTTIRRMTGDVLNVGFVLIDKAVLIYKVNSVHPRPLGPGYRVHTFQSSLAFLTDGVQLGLANTNIDNVKVGANQCDQIRRLFVILATFVFHQSPNFS